MKFKKSKIDREINYDAFNPKRQNEFKYVDSTLNANGLGYPQRLSVLSSINRESQGDPLAVSDNEKWKGLIQWDSLRYIPTSTDSKEELKSQSDHLNWELQGPGWNGNDSLKTVFFNSNNLEDVNKAFVEGFVRPGDKEKETKIRYNNAVKGLTFPRVEFPAIDSNLSGAPTRYQDGGSIVYQEFVNPNLQQPKTIGSKAKDININDFTIPVYNPKFPVEPVTIDKSIDTNQQSTIEDQVEFPQVQKESTNIATPLSWNQKDLDILNVDGSNLDKQRVTNKYLQEQLGLTKEQAAALVGVWQAESSFNLNAANQAEKEGKNSAVKSSQYGIGIGQWTGSRHDDFVNYINSHGGSYNLKNQLDFAINEIKTKYPDFLNNLRSSNNVKDATAYTYVQYVGANERNIKDLSDLYARVNKTVNRYRKKHLELYGKASNGFEQRLKYAIDSLNIT